jgi:hypothetical protein
MQACQLVLAGLRGSLDQKAIASFGTFDDAARGVLLARPFPDHFQIMKTLVEQLAGA